jgi:hypothetical protein
MRSRQYLLSRALSDILQRSLFAREKVRYAPCASLIDHATRAIGVVLLLELLPSLTSQRDRPSSAAMGRLAGMPNGHPQLPLSRFEDTENAGIEIRDHRHIRIVCAEAFSA